MTKDIELLVYNRFNDRGSISSVLSDVIEIDADAVSIGGKLLGWRWKCGGEEAPVVVYYDGELLELAFAGGTFSIRAGGPEVELLAVNREENIHVHESLIVTVRQKHLCTVHRLPSWSEMFRKGSFNALVLGALPQAANDTIARLWYIRTLSVYNSLFLLLPETVAALEREAEHEAPYALFALGRYHLCTQKDPDSTARAVNCFEKAWESGLIEAAVALAMSYDSGDIGMVDRLKAKTLLETAMKEDCEYAAKYQIYKMIYGVKGSRQALPEAMRICKSLIDNQKKDLGEDNVNPIWHYYLGIAKRMSEGCTHGAEDIRAAAEAGLIMAWSDLAIALSHDDDENMIDKAAFLSTIRRGAASRDDLCMYFLAMAKVEDFDDMSEYRQALASRQLLIDLEGAYNGGSSEAAETLGDIYYSGQYGCPQDDEKAFSYYAKGALFCNTSCYEKMFDMIRDHYIDKPQEFRDMLALYGTRAGSRRLLSETVIAYTYGRLTEYAAEIEQLYEPVFDDEEYDEDFPDDDGRFDAYS